MPAIRIEPMQAADLDAVLEIERVSFPSPWSRHAFLYELRENRVAHLWVARGAAPDAEDGAPAPVPASPIAGYLCLWVIVDEVHVTNLAVHPAYRRRGIGRLLLGTLLAHYRAQGAARAVLEVRPNNVEALGLYRGLGFREVGLRRGYYVDTGEDALLLEADLGRVPPPGPGVEPPRDVQRSR